MRNFNSHVRNDKIKWVMTAIAFLLLAVLLCGLMTSWFKDWNPYCWFGHTYGEDGICTKCAAEKPAEVEEEEKPVEEEVAQLKVNHFFASSKMMSLSATPAANNAGVSQTLTATVTSTLANPKIDWTVEREDGTEVTEVVVVPTSDGALTATVTCYSAFDDVILVRATLRDVGSYALANVLFEGKPSSLSASSATLSESGGYFKAATLGNHTINLNLNNVFGVVGEKYGEYDMVITKHGTIVYNEFSMQTMLPGMPPIESPTGNTITKSFSEIDTMAAGLFDFTISGGTLSINAETSITTFQFNTFPNEYIVYRNRFKSVSEDCYYSIKLTEKISGLSVTIKVGFGDALLSTVALSNDTIIF